MDKKQAEQNRNISNRICHGNKSKRVIKNPKEHHIIK